MNDSTSALVVVVIGNVLIAASAWGCGTYLVCNGHPYLGVMMLLMPLIFHIDFRKTQGMDK